MPAKRTSARKRICLSRKRNPEDTEAPAQGEGQEGDRLPGLSATWTSPTSPQGRVHGVSRQAILLLPAHTGKILLLPVAPYLPFGLSRHPAPTAAMPRSDQAATPSAPG